MGSNGFQEPRIRFARAGTAVWSSAEVGIPEGCQKISPGWGAAQFAAAHPGSITKKRFASRRDASASGDSETPGAEHTFLTGQRSTTTKFGTVAPLSSLAPQRHRRSASDGLLGLCAW